MRTLVGKSDSLAELYAVPAEAESWLRVNMVSTVDGAATGESGNSKSINNAADKQVFDLLREQADVLVVGAGTLRIEGYAVPPKPLVVVTRSGEVPPSLADAPPGRVLMATVSTSPGLMGPERRLAPFRIAVAGMRRLGPGERSIVKAPVTVPSAMGSPCGLLATVLRIRMAAGPTAASGPTTARTRTNSPSAITA